jgi:uncharacterized membrane protein
VARLPSLLKEGTTMEHGYGPPGGFGFPHGFGILFWLLHTAMWIGALLLLAWILWRWVGPRLRSRATPLFVQQPAPLSPLERLRLRYAAGEIDETTFEQMRERLQATYQPGGRDAPPPQGQPLGYQEEGGIY